MSTNKCGSSADTVVCSGESHESDNDSLIKPWGRITPITNGQATTTEPFEIWFDTIIGSNVDCTLSIVNDMFTPDIQCWITKDISRVYNPVLIEDLSCTGIFINGKRQKFLTKTVIKSGDKVAFNKSENEIFIFDNNFESQCVSKKVNLRFHVGHVLGTGSFGKVFRVFDRETVSTFAMKELTLNQPERSISYVSIDQAHHEVNITRGLLHEFVIKFYDVVWERNAVYMILEYMDGGDLREFINRKINLSVQTSRRIFRQLSSAVEYLHHQQIVHCDIKPENILLTKNDTVAKLVDFGFSQKLKKNSLLEKCGTSVYAAPEVHNREKCDAKIDIWSLGAVLYVMLSSVLPFPNIAAVQRGELDNGVLANLPEAATDLIKKLLIVKSGERLSIDKVQVHDWLSEATDNIVLV